MATRATRQRQPTVAMPTASPNTKHGRSGTPFMCIAVAMMLVTGMLPLLIMIHHSQNLPRQMLQDDKSAGKTIILPADVGGADHFKAATLRSVPTPTPTPQPPPTSTFIQEGTSDRRYFSDTTFDVNSNSHYLSFGAARLNKTIQRISKMDPPRTDRILVKYRMCVIERLLYQVLRALAGCGIPHIVEGGTLLGLWRSGGIMPWDPDADVLFFGDDAAEVVRCLRNSPFLNKRTVVVAVTPRKAEGGFVPVKVADAMSGIFVDIVGPAVTDTNSRTVSWYGEGVTSLSASDIERRRGGVQGSTTQDIDTVFPIRTNATFHNLPYPVPVPARVAEWLVQMFPGGLGEPENKNYEIEMKALANVDLHGECSSLRLG